MLDVVIRGARIFDGSGGPERAGDIGIAGGLIVEVGSSIESGAGREEIEAAGNAVMPGIVDLHTHSDVSVMSDPACLSAIGQGVTTQVVGLCGFSAAPVSPATLPSMIDEEPIAAFPGVAWDWSSMGDYLAAVERAQPATNIVSFVGHSTLRRFVVGTSDRPPTSIELDRMQSLLRESFAAGARGFSTGLTYAPGMFAEADEIVALASVAARVGLPYHTHMRYGDAGVYGSVVESLDHARAAEVELNISHLYPRPDAPEDEPQRYFDLIEAANAGGMNVTFDVTVFNRGGGAWVQLLPRWVRDGGHGATIERLADAGQRPGIADEVTSQDDWAADWDDQLIVKVNRPENASLVGRTIADIAEERGQGPLDTALDLVIEDGQFWVAPHIKAQPHLDAIISHPLSVPITDGMAQHPVEHRSLGIMPKTFGSFPLVLGNYVRDRGVLTLPDAVRRMTSEPARRAGLSDRGAIKPGAAADLLIFDPDSIANRASEEGDPGAAPAGISRVMVNGRWALVDGAHSELRYGRSL